MIVFWYHQTANVTQATRHASRFFAAFFILLVLTTSPSERLNAAEPLAADLVTDGQPIDVSSSRYRELFAELQRDHQFSEEELQRLFAGVKINRKVLELMDRQWEAKPYHQYRPLFVTPKTIATGRKKMAEHEELLDRIEAEFGVDREVVVAIWGIESRFGTHRGSFPVFETLNTLFDAYPRRSTFFRTQLVHFLLLCRENQMDPMQIKGSYAGAFGQPQFIPSSLREYAVSFDDDDITDVFNSIEDVFASIANYLKRFHWTLDAPIYVDIGPELNSAELIAALQKGRKGKVEVALVSADQGVNLPESPDNRKVIIVGLELAPFEGGGFRYVAGYPNFQAIIEWNHSSRYAMAVAELAEAIKAE
ncbi:lytic murein transglycosylase [Desulfofustis limnaeus]|jgi:membrane-bound lytic murein transglycosylase B|uniref:Soluble lytic transglycosylase B n=1 Tax=Desulfofustis limnaeus TaxID=2740163 RepID=A0ABN6M9L4_9BACT|nr:lytic murein transglycosylase [Desulfofustis limnaeus]MDX9894860.1 lytic murein transglycosylase [Desulfofustis sp.]BDD88019.1 soluble lytic transglycosylase B [Desulfofustis limnaeus]